MGRYVNGTKHFSYKYVYGEQPTNLSDLAGWAGFGDVEGELAIRTQLFADYDEDRAGVVDGVGWVTTVYEATIPPSELKRRAGLELGWDVEDAIYAISDAWQKVVKAIDSIIDGIAISPDLGVAGRFVLRKDEWAALAERIGHWY